MSQDGTERTKLGLGFDVLGVGDTTVNLDGDAEMGDTASSSVRVLGEAVPESLESSLGLTRSDVPAADLTSSVTGPRTSGMRTVDDADSQATHSAAGTGHMSAPAPSGSHVTVPAYQAATAASSRRTKPKSSLGRALTIRTKSSKMRASMARLRQTRMTRYIALPVPVTVQVTHDTVSRENADAAKQRQTELELELQKAGNAFHEERTIRERDVTAVQVTIGALQDELQKTNTRVNAQEAAVQDLTGISGDLRAAQQQMAAQRTEFAQMKTFNDKLVDRVDDLTAVFHAIDDVDEIGEDVNTSDVNDTPAHVQGDSPHVNEPVGHVPSVPTAVIDLVSQDSREQSVGGGINMMDWLDQKEKIRLGKQPVHMPVQNPATPMTSSPGPMTSSSVPVQSALHGNAPHAATSSQYAVQTGSLNRTPTIQAGDMGTRRVVVDTPPTLPSGTQKAIERMFQAYLERIGVHPGHHKAKALSRTAVRSTVGNVTNPGPETQQLAFPRIQDNVAPLQGQQVFSTAQWRPKEPPMFTGAVTDDVYLWTSLVKQYFVFMNGNAHQEVAFAATLLRGAAHEWYMGYERRNGNRPPQDWPTLKQAILERFGSNIREQEAHAKLLTVSQGKRSVRDYTAEFETLLGRLSTRDEDTWKRMYVWGLQPHLARAVALKYPATIAQAAGHAEEIELTIRASQRPNLGQQGARATTSYSARGGSQPAPRPFGQGRGQGNVGANQQRGRGFGGRRGGGWSRDRRGGQQSTTQAKTGTHCFNCGQYGHYAAQCPRGTNTSGSGNTGQSVNQRSNFAQARGGPRENRGNIRGGGNKRTRFSGLNVVYDAEGNEYPIDENGKLVIDVAEKDYEDASNPSSQNQEKSGN